MLLLVYILVLSIVTLLPKLLVEAKSTLDPGLPPSFVFNTRDHERIKASIRPSPLRCHQRGIHPVKRGNARCRRRIGGMMMDMAVGGLSEIEVKRVVSQFEVPEDTEVRLKSPEVKKDGAVKILVTIAPPHTGPQQAVLLRRLQEVDPNIINLQVQEFYTIKVEEQAMALVDQILDVIQSSIPPPLPPPPSFSPSLTCAGSDEVLQIHQRAFAPRPAFRSVWSSNVRSILTARGVFSGDKEGRELIDLESGRWYRVFRKDNQQKEQLSQEVEQILHDRMTECLTRMPQGMEWGTKNRWFVGKDEELPHAWTTAEEETMVLPLIEKGLIVLEEMSKDFGLGLGPWELTFLAELFVNELRRNPTQVEIFDVAQSLSEHCRHWTFDGRFVIDGQEQAVSLMAMIKRPLARRKEGDDDDNSLLAFCDNSSAIRGSKVLDLHPYKPDQPSPFTITEGVRHLILTAETHNFPCSIAPFPGAQTGVGGRIRDILATGRGAYTLSGLAGYAVGDLSPSSSSSYQRPRHIATPLQILIRASDGASDYANKYGEPLVGGFTRAMPSWRGHEFLKPIMFSAGLGKLPEESVYKHEADVGMAVVKLGGPAYRVGLGGGAASSKIGGDPELNLQAVQRGDPQMGNKVGRAVRACLEMPINPLQSIHDQGAGGNANVLKELVAPAGADIFLNRFTKGDASLSPLEVWGAEYQESQGVLVSYYALGLLQCICDREATPMEVVGSIAGHGAIKLYRHQKDVIKQSPTLVDLPLEPLLDRRPLRTIIANPEKEKQPSGLRAGRSDGRHHLKKKSLREILRMVLGTVSVGSKAFLTNKVDRSVTGLVASQPCVGPFHLPVADVGVTALSYWGEEGVASAIGECPGIGLIDTMAMVRMAVGEAITNLVWSPVNRWSDVKLQANWMWPGREGHNAAKLYEGVATLSDFLLDLGLALDGGKDSLSMATDCDDDVRVPSPATLVVTAYAHCPRITEVITPDVKLPSRGEEGVLLLLDVGEEGGRRRLGGSAFAQVVEGSPDNDGLAYDTVSDISNASLLRNGFECVQELMKRGLVQAGHDLSSGGLITTVLEMVMSGDAGARLNLPSARQEDAMEKDEYLERILFSEELGLVLEVKAANLSEIVGLVKKHHVPHSIIGTTTKKREVVISLDDVEVLREGTKELMKEWQAPSLALERLQTNPKCVEAEERALTRQRRPQWLVPFKLRPTGHPKDIAGSIGQQGRPRVAIMREQGSNGDREMAAAFLSAGFEVWDVTVSDLIQGRVDLTAFQGLAFVGGFSYGDVLGSARGWASVLQGNIKVKQQLDDFVRRPDTWSLGVCNGCQLLAALGVVPGFVEDEDDKEPSAWLAENESGRFESRFVTVRIESSPSILLKGMEGAVLGVWSAHGEGRMQFKTEKVTDYVMNQGLSPVCYVDPCNHGERTEDYPFNPNGSPGGMAALCSPDGRHLAIMPHPERCWLDWQMPWMPEEIKTQEGLKEPYSPWFRMFQNAYDFSILDLDQAI